MEKTYDPPDTKGEERKQATQKIIAAQKKAPLQKALKKQKENWVKRAKKLSRDGNGMDLNRGNNELG